MANTSIEKLKELKEEMNKKYQARILKEQSRAKKKAKEELRSHIEYALTGFKLNELRELEKTNLVYGIFELYTKLSDTEKNELRKRSKELEEEFREIRKARHKVEKDESKKEGINEE